MMNSKHEHNNLFGVESTAVSDSQCAILSLPADKTPRRQIWAVSRFPAVGG